MSLIEYTRDEQINKVDEAIKRLKALPDDVCIVVDSDDAVIANTCRLTSENAIRLLEGFKTCLSNRRGGKK